MKDIRPAIRALLLANPAVSTAVGGSRIYPVVLPQGQTADSVVQNLVTEASDYHLQSASGLGTARMQIDCWSLTADGAVTLGRSRRALFRGTITFGSLSQDTLLVRGMLLDQRRDDYDNTAGCSAAAGFCHVVLGNMAPHLRSKGLAELDDALTERESNRAQCLRGCSKEPIADAGATTRPAPARWRFPTR